MEKSLKEKFPVLIIFVLVFLIVGFFIFSRSKNLSKSDQKESSFIVTLTEDGFSPQNITIKKGETITFKTSRNKMFWPASNLHPTHEIYPEFDPKKPIEPGKDWQFQFDRIGRWRFHDHLAPQFSGEIIVGEISNFSKNCDKDSTNKIYCWEDQITEKLNKEGLDSAYELLSKLYNSEPSFAVACHGIVHKLGYEAYKKFVNQKDIILPSNTSYCEYGYYHGFIGALIQSGKNLSLAREFCHNAKIQFKNSSIIEDACYHGIGHGVTDGSDPSAYGDPQALINPALKLCNELGDTDFQKVTCATGVFSSLANMYRQTIYRLHADKSNPYKICYNQTEENFKIACFGQMNSLTLYLLEGDFSKGVKLVNNIQKDNYARIAIKSLASIAELGASQSDQIKFIEACHKIRQSLHKYCISGLGNGLVNHGQPNSEYVEAVKLCEMDIITDEEKNACFSNLFQRFDILYTRSKNAEICRSLIKEDQKNCKEYMVN